MIDKMIPVIVFAGRITAIVILSTCANVSLIQQSVLYHFI